MEIMALIGVVLKLALVLFGEYFSAKERARKRKEEFVLDENKRRAIFEIAYSKMQKDLAKDSASIQSYEDRIEELLKKH